jgi:hypothetical protein
MGLIRIDLSEHIGTGLIIKRDTGVIYTIQTAGNFCLMPEAEGLFLSVGNDVDGSLRFISLQDEFVEYFKEPNIVGEGAIHGISTVNADYIDKLLKKADLRFIKVNRKLLDKSHEGWVHVEVFEDIFGQTIVLESKTEKYPLKGVLVWRC